MRASGLVLDFYDDQTSAAVFKSIYPAHECIPETVKTAHVLTTAEQEQLPDDAFALVMLQDDGGYVRKYACVDPGNTVLSVEYFLQNKDKLPDEAQKVAAANLIEACKWYDLTPPDELVKAASFNVFIAGARVPQMYAQTKERVHAGVHDAVNDGWIIAPPGEKKAEVSATPIMPVQQDTDASTGTAKAVVKKTAAIGHLVQGKVHHPTSEHAEALALAGYVKGVQPQARQQRQLSPHVNVQGVEPSSPTKLKVAGVTALRGRYPLDTYEQVKAASAYFDENIGAFSPADRHEYCINMVKRATALHIPVSETARKYGSAQYAPAEEVELALATRRSLLSDEGVSLLNKLAAARPTVDPDVFALALSEMDKKAGLHYYYDSDVYDPYFSTFGFKKEATYAECIGDDYVNEFMLQQVATSEYAFLKEHFGEDMASEFKQDPVGIFKSLPVDQKKIIMRLAAQA